METIVIYSQMIADGTGKHRGTYDVRADALGALWATVWRFPVTQAHRKENKNG